MQFHSYYPNLDAIEPITQPSPYRLPLISDRCYWTPGILLQGPPVALSLPNHPSGPNHFLFSPSSSAPVERKLRPILVIPNQSPYSRSTGALSPLLLFFFSLWPFTSFLPHYLVFIFHECLLWGGGGVTKTFVDLDVS